MICGTGSGKAVYQRDPDNRDNHADHGHRTEGFIKHEIREDGCHGRNKEKQTGNSGRLAATNEIEQQNYRPKGQRKGQPDKREYKLSRPVDDSDPGGAPSWY